MKRLTLILASMGVAIFTACGVALAATFVGDDGPNTIVGTTTFKVALKHPGNFLGRVQGSHRSKRFSVVGAG